MSTTRAVTGIKYSEPLIFDRSRPGRIGFSLTSRATDGDCDDIPAALRRTTPPALPEISEPEAVRHYVRLSQHNFAVDHGMYPLGSCTMKYNPKINEVAARMPGFAELHPYMPEAAAQGALHGGVAGVQGALLHAAPAQHRHLERVEPGPAAHRHRGDLARRGLGIQLAEGPAELIGPGLAAADGQQTEDRPDSEVFGCHMGAG